MANVTISPQTAKATAIVPAFTSLNATDTFKIANTGQLFLYGKNVTASSVLTIDTPLSVGGLAVADQVINFAIGDEKIIGPFPPHLYGDTLSVTSDSVNLSLSAVSL